MYEDCVSYLSQNDFGGILSGDIVDKYIYILLKTHATVLILIKLLNITLE